MIFIDFPLVQSTYKSMKVFFSIIVVMALAVAPVAFGHGINASLHPTSHEMVHGDAGNVSCNDENSRDSEMIVCCDVFGGHCTSGLFLKELTTLVISRPQVVKLLILSDRLWAGLDPEVETPPPRI